MILNEYKWISKIYYMDFEVIDIPMFNVVWGITMDMNGYE